MSTITRQPQQEKSSAQAQSIETIGRSHPLGATPVAGGVNFSIYSRDASNVELLFFDREDDGRPARVIPIDPAANRTYHYWHVFVPGVTAGPDLRLSGSRTFRARAGSPLRSHQAPARSVRPRRRGSQKLQPHRRQQGRGQHSHGYEERGGGSTAHTIGKATHR